MSSEQLRGSVVHLNINSAGGVPKHQVAEAAITTAGVVGDKQRDRRYHGGPERAVCLFSQERITALQAEGHPISPGSTGENVTIGGIDWDMLAVGDCLQIGERVMLQITSYAVPCQNIAGSFSDGVFKRMSQKLHPGWSRLYTRVLSEGTIREGDTVEWVVAGG